MPRGAKGDHRTDVLEISLDLVIYFDRRDVQDGRLDAHVPQDILQVQQDLLGQEPQRAARDQGGAVGRPAPFDNILFFDRGI